MHTFSVLQKIRRERAWRPLNVVACISQDMLDRYANAKTAFTGGPLLFKLVTKYMSAIYNCDQL